MKAFSVRLIDFLVWAGFLLLFANGDYNMLRVKYGKPIPRKPFFLFILSELIVVGICLAVIFVLDAV